MIPIFLAPRALRIALAGRAERAASRLAWLHAAGAAPDVWSDRPSAEFAQAAGPGLRRMLPSADDLRAYHVIWIADLPFDVAENLAHEARAAGVLTNVEDMRALCDFHSPALVRRGALTLAAGTGGASPAVARAARERLEQAFPESWGDALRGIAESRTALRRDGVSSAALAADARAQLAEKGLI